MINIIAFFMLFPSLVGFYCTSGVNVSAPDQHFTGLGGKCPVGHECQEGSSTFHPCDPGYYAAVEGMSTCDTCPAVASVSHLNLHLISKSKMVYKYVASASLHVLLQDKPV